MARKSNRLTTSINVPVPRDLKRRVIELAEQAPGQPKPTAFARALIQEGVDRRQPQPTEELAGSSAK